jgi:hypothetical protein
MIKKWSSKPAFPTQPVTSADSLTLQPAENLTNCYLKKRGRCDQRFARTALLPRTSFSASTWPSQLPHACHPAPCDQISDRVPIPPSQPDLSCTHPCHIDIPHFQLHLSACLIGHDVACVATCLCGMRIEMHGRGYKYKTDTETGRVGSGERTVDMKRIKVQVSITAPLSLSLFRAICAGFGNGRGRLLRVSEVLVSSSRRRQGSPASVPRCTAIRRQRDANDHQAQITRVPSCESGRPQCETSASSRLT